MVYESIKNMIITLELAPGQVVSEELLMHQLGVGRTPLREALRRLSNEGLIRVFPRRGMYVSEISIVDLQNICEVRLILESLCARLAAERIREPELQELRLLLKEAEHLTETEDARRLVEVDRRFHHVVATASRNTYLETILVNLYDHSLRLWFLSLIRTRKAHEVLCEHAEIVKALEARDPVAAEKVSADHIIQFRNKVRAVLLD
ncbi:MAG: GntR family transcriptional regulator [Candidatus Methanomethyliaceae archaeon]